MHRSRIKMLLQKAKEGESIKICGWVKSKRVSKKFAFVVINDGSTQNDLQLIIDAATPAFAVVDKCSTGSPVEVYGVMKASPGQGQEWEVVVNELKVFGSVDAQQYPLQKKGHSLEFLREIGHLRGRTNTFGAVFRVRNRLSTLIHDFFQNRGFLWVHTPIITGSDCEGAGELFQVTTLDLRNPPRLESGSIDYSKDFFGSRANLSVSGQLNGEAMALCFGDVYTFGPTFRAENSNTTRHLSEFWMIEPEVAFADLKDNMLLAEEFLTYLFTEIVNSCPDELEFLSKHYKDTSIEQLQKLASQPFARISYTQAIEELSKSARKFEYPVKWGMDLQTEHERFLTENLFCKPVIVVDYPKAIKAFYMKLNPDDTTVAAMDVLVPRIGEIIGGSQREDNYDFLQAKMAKAQIPISELQWYMDLRTYGSTPHAGFGLGFERLVQYVTGMANIRDVIPFPRAPQSINF